MEMLLSLGGAVKALGNGKVGGYLVTFGDASTPDHSAYHDYFTAQTDYAVDEWPAKSSVYYHHGMDADLGKKRLGNGGTMKAADEVGVWIEAQLNMRDEWETAVYALAEAGKLSWSSGSAPHLVERVAVKAGGQIIAHEIKAWPLGLDASLTPTPADHRCDVVALKALPSLAELRAGKTATKASLLGECLPQQMTMAALRTLNDALFYSVLYDVLFSERVAAADRIPTLTAAFDEFRDVALQVITALLAVPEETAAVKSALKTLWGPVATTAVPEALNDHSRQVVSAVQGFAERLESRWEARKSDGRTLSAANLADLALVQESLADLDSVKGRLATLGSGGVVPAPVLTPAPAAVIGPDLDLLQLRARACLALAGAH